MRRLLLTLSLCLAAPVTAQKVDGAPPSFPGEAEIGPSKPINAPLSGGTIVPASAANVMTNRANSIPWSWTPTRFQAPYNSSEMPNSLLIRCLSFRHGARVDTGATIDLQMWLGFTTFDSTNITNNYANNVQGQLTEVFTRKMFKVDDMGTRNTNPRFFKYAIPLDKPFIWTKRTGRNLLWECKVHGNTNSNRSFSFFPEQAISGTTRIYSNNNANATTGFISRNLAPVLKFGINCNQPKKFAEVTKYGSGCRGTGGFAGVVVPGDYASNFGNSSNSFPFSRGNMRYQQLHRGSELGNRPLRLDGLSVRQDDRSSGRAGGQRSIEVRLGQTDRDPLAPGPLFDKNYDSNGGTSVFKGNINIPTLAGLNTDATKFVQLAKFSTPYNWIPRPGKNLVIEVIMSDSASINVSFFDAASFFPDATRIYNSVSSTAANATTGTRNYALIFGLDASGSVGNAVPAIGNKGVPQTGCPYDITVSSAKASTAALVSLGFSDKMFGAFTLPLDLSPFGFTSCSLLSSLDVLIASSTDAKGNGSATLTIPNDAGLVNISLYHQWLIVDPSANSGGLAFSDAAKATIGDG